MGKPRQISFEVEIDGKKENFVMDKWGTERSYNMLTVVSEYFGVPATMLIGKGEEGFVDNLPNALLMLIQTIKAQSFISFSKEVLSGLYANSGTVDVASNIEIFDDDPSALQEVVAIVLFENLQCFFKRGFNRLASMVIPLVQQAAVLKK